MRLTTIRTETGTRAGRVDGDRVVLLDAVDVAAVLARGIDTVSETGETVGYDSADLAPLVPRPGKIICLGLNYETHIRELGRELPTYPTLFAKFYRTLTGPHDPIALPRASKQLDWEAELAFVIGRKVRHASRSEALDAIAGYTIMNDVSARDWQWRTTQWLQGKMLEATTPLGPVLVTPDEIDHARDLDLRCEVDGDLMQRARTSDLLFTPADIVAYISQVLTLDPGDVISTGTPGGVGAGRDPQAFLQPGQVVRCTIDGIGELLNTCVEQGDA